MCTAEYGQSAANFAALNQANQNKQQWEKQYRQDYLDHMAKAAIPGILSEPGCFGFGHGQIAKLAYDIAEAMWVERESRK